MRITDELIKRTLRETGPTKHGIKLSDGKGLYLHVRKSGTASWRHKFNFKGTEQLATLGTYPECSIEDARNRRYQNRKALDDGKNPLEKKREEKKAAANKFGDIAEEYIKTQESALAERTIKKKRWQLRLIRSALAALPITSIKRTHVLSALRKIENTGGTKGKGRIETAHKTLELIGQVFDYAIAAGHTEYNIVRGASKALKKRPTDNHFAAITKPVEIGKLLRAIEGATGQPATIAALRLAPHVFLRPGELRKGKWTEIDFDAAQWNVPAARMKSKRDHIVPLSRQALDILRGIKEITGDCEFIFPAIGPKRRSISENTLGVALRKLDYSSDQMVPHGFRAMARTNLDEVLKIRVDIIEHQLAHEVIDANGRAYNRTTHLPERADMMQKWSDYLDALRVGGNVVPIRRSA